MIPVAKPLVGEEGRAAVDAVLASGGLPQGSQVPARAAEIGSTVAIARIGTRP